MQLLVDTHAFLWEVLDDRRLSIAAQQAWDDVTNDLFISPASLWEIAIKVSKGKLHIGRSLDDFFAIELAKNNVQLLSISIDHAARVSALPHLHGDPFDRMLVAQSLCESLPILSADALLDGYGVQRVW